MNSKKAIPAEKSYRECPECGSTNIISNRDINNAFIQCQDCGYYLREGDINHRNKNYENTATALNTNNLTIRDDSVILPCSSCEKNDVCKYKNTVEFSLKRFELEEPFTIEIKCKYYKAIIPLTPGYPSYPKPIPTNPGITWGGPTCPMCGSHEVDPTFYSLSVLPMYKCAKCGHEYTWEGGLTYCGDTVTGTNTSIDKSEPTVKITGNTEVK